MVNRPGAPLLAELDDFLGSLRLAAGREDASAALAEALRRLEASILAYAAYGGRERLLEVLTAASRVELTLARRQRSKRQGFPRP